ncbi:hypothetical protein PNEG_03164 [Pneumocystis murina B123]|uniref:MI domain-containing protein n=1 Tax=Pneumocystis murina (strain B123) TaxID=1069680 RepID=M7PD00_PNEMU|nr:hypothetical protein PNEG_03164 [Pneumocystis murina B123]EMR08324.1 hypothetical protein PNEG_03164 [Pneumocystis murina B123]
MRDKKTKKKGKQGKKEENEDMQMNKTIIKIKNENLSEEDLKKYSGKKREKTINMKYKGCYDAEDDVIEYLEKKLKRKNQNINRKNKKDELDYLLEDLNYIDRKKTKRVKFMEDSSVLCNSEVKNKTNINKEELFIEDKENKSNLDRENGAILVKKNKENPYIAPVGNGISITKNKILKDDKNNNEFTIHLKRKIKGLLNRLTESNMLSILNEIENLYSSNPRHYVNLELITLLLKNITSQTTLKETYLVLHSGFITALYKIIGIDFGAFFLQKLIKTFNEFYSKENSKKENIDTNISYDKECINLIIVLSELYNFQVISCTFVYDLIKLFLKEITDLNTELLLKIILNSGSQLRCDDPSSLKDIIIIIHRKISETDVVLNTRTKFMIESIDNLKNNKIKDIPSIMTREAIVRMKKFLGTLSNRNSNRNFEPLKISLSDIESMDENGKWWHAGSSSRKEEKRKTPISVNSFYEKKETELLTLAQLQRMNTDIRKSIFITLMSGEDFVDAYEKLLKLRLKKVQKLEIPRVLLHCCGNERNYNPYYAYIALRFCVRMSFLRTAFKFCLWDLFRSLGEKDIQVIGNTNTENTENISLRYIVNLGRLYGFLVVNDGLDLAIFKKLNFFHLQSKTKTFLEIFFCTLIQETQKRSNIQSVTSIQKIFEKLSSNPSLIVGIKYFIEKYLKNSEILNSRDKEIFIWDYKKVLEILSIPKNI